MLTPDQIDAIEAEIQSVLSGGQMAVAALTPVVPELAAALPFLILGKAVAKAFPPLANDVQALLSKKEPTQEDVSALAQSIVALQNPESL